MTSAQTMSTSGSSVTRGDRRRRARLAAVLLALGAGGCTGTDSTLTPGAALVAPWTETRLWAVVPPANESGVSIVEEAAVADEIAHQLQLVRGIDAVPVNRVIVAMRRLAMNRVTTDRDADALMNALGVDGLIIGSVTAWEPYPPLRIGLALQLHQRARPGRYDIDPVTITRETRGEAAPGGHGGDAVVTAAGIFDASDHLTLMQLKTFSAGRHEPDSAYGADIYLVSMDLFTQFASHRLIRDLLWQERLRVTSVAVNQAER